MGYKFRPVHFWNEFLGEEPEHEIKIENVDRSNLNNPLSKFVGNDKVVKKLQVVAYNAMGKQDHDCSGINFSVFGMPSTGKTTLVRQFAELLQLPFCEISPKGISKLSDLKDQIMISIVRHKTMFGSCEVTQNNEDRSTFPPCIIFIDEVHALSDYIVNGLLKATEFNDATLVIENGEVYDCRNICWFIGTTEEGQLFDAFRSRFSPLQLNYLTRKEISRIIKNVHGDFDDNVCDLISFYNSRLPRKALEFARYLKLKKNMQPEVSYEDLCKEIALEEGIDEQGMNIVHLSVLKALKDTPVAKNRLTTLIGKKIDEVENYIMPVLLSSTEDQASMVRVTNKGYEITANGMNELRKRGLA